MFRWSCCQLAPRVHPKDAAKHSGEYHRAARAVSNKKASHIILPNSVASDQATGGEFFSALGANSTRQFHRRQEADRYSAEMQGRLDHAFYNKKHGTKRVQENIVEEGVTETIRARIAEDKFTFTNEIHKRALDRNILEECYRESHGKRHERTLQIGHGWEKWVARDEKNIAVLGGSKKAQETFGMGGTVNLVKSAGHASDFPVNHLPEIAFVGPTNAGKSSLINAVLNSFVTDYGDLPGTTQKFNFYSVGNKLMLVDTPGIGFQNQMKRTSLDEHNALDLLKSYLDEGHPRKQVRNIRRVFVLFPEASWSSTMNRVMQELQFRRMPFDVIITKTDKVPTKFLAKKVDFTRAEIARSYSMCKGIYMASSLRLAGISKIQNLLADYAGDADTGDAGVSERPRGKRISDPGLELIDSLV